MIETRVLPDAAAVAEAAEERFVELARTATAEGRRLAIALAGGSTPRDLYARLAVRDLCWEAVHFFWGDERCVPPESPDSNFRMAAEVLLDRIELPGKNVHRIPAELGPVLGARRYAEELRGFFAGPARFDLVHLGVGLDGHVASIFPATRADATAEVLPTVPTPGLEPAVARVSLAPAVFDAAAEVHVLATGAAKAAVVGRAVRGDRSIPAGRLDAPLVRWYLDAGAAGEHVRVPVDVPE